MILTNFERQSNKSDWWPDGLQLIADDDEPLWSTKPADLVVTLSIGFRKGCDCTSSTPMKIFLSSDSPNYVEAFDDGKIAIEIPAEKLSDMEPGQYPIFIKIETQDRTYQAVIGELPIVQGA